MCVNAAPLHRYFGGRGRGLDSISIAFRRLESVEWNSQRKESRSTHNCCIRSISSSENNPQKVSMRDDNQQTKSASMITAKAQVLSLHQDVQIGSALVIGGCGFLGHHIVKALLAEATCTSVSVMSRDPFKRRFPDVAYHVGDITKPEHVENIIDQVKPNIIINTASPHAYIDHEHAHEYFSVKYGFLTLSEFLANHT